MVPTATMSDARRKQLEWGVCLGPKQVQLVTMHSQDFSNKRRASQRVGFLMDFTSLNILGCLDNEGCVSVNLSLPGLLDQDLDVTSSQKVLDCNTAHTRQWSTPDLKFSFQKRNKIQFFKYFQFYKKINFKILLRELILKETHLVQKLDRNTDKHPSSFEYG